MRKQMLDKVNKAQAFLAEGDFSNGKGEEFLKYLLRWIEWFQHERLIHLMVTIAFFFVALIGIIAFFLLEEIMFIVMSLIVFVTFGFYIEHYFLLENKTQLLYSIYDEIEGKIRNQVNKG